MKKGASESAGGEQVPVPAPSPSPSAASNDDKTQSEDKSEAQPVGLDSITASILSGWASALKFIGLVEVGVVGSYVEAIVSAMSSATLHTSVHVIRDSIL